MPEAEPAPAAAENPRHPKKKKAGPALRCVGVRGTSGREYRADAVLVATGGVSYPTTGSTGDGYKLAQQAGHTLVEPVPSLVSLVSRDPDCKKMMGLALKNVTLTLLEDGKAIFDEQGEMLFTHFGISGPLTLSASSHLGDMKKHRYIAEIDLKPALSEEQLYDRITRDFALLANHAAQGALVKLLPSSMQPVMVARWGIDPATKANQITREQKRELVRLVKHWQVSIDARGDLAHAVITSGGVSVREVDPIKMPERRFWFFRTTIQAFCLVIEKGAVDYCVLSISLKPGSKNTASATMIMPIPQMTNHFSTPSRSARGPEMTRPNGMAREAALVSREKTLPRYSGLTVS